MRNQKSIYPAFILFMLILAFSHMIRYAISGGHDIVFTPPNAFCFNFDVDTSEGPFLALSSDDFYNPELSENGYDKDTNTYHVYVNSIYLDNDDAYMYVSGDYWNYPFKPVIKVNGHIVDEVSSDNTGYAQNPFSDIYYSKMYHFYYRDRIISERTYELYVRFGKLSESINVVFHAS
ncbi:MAG: hypothetical protein IJK52_10180 [Oscillospiraceae bacterium]|nr:hypothetical protein [Oscillospiraceae bacterium]